MILKALFQDESKVTFDCAKATMSKGSIIDISDAHWKQPEIQNAIKMGLIELIGPEPILPGEALGMAPEQEIKFRNVYDSKLCFDCMKSYVDPGKVISISVSKIDMVEVRNAISYGWLVNVETENDNIPHKGLTAPVLLEELTAKDILPPTGNKQNEEKQAKELLKVAETIAPVPEVSVKKEVPEEVLNLTPEPTLSGLASNLEDMMDSPKVTTKPQSITKPQPTQAKAPEIPIVRPKPKKSDFKAKPISAAKESDNEVNELLKPSEVVMAKPKNKKVIPPVPVLVEGDAKDDEEIDFDKLFSKTKKEPW
jgi:hypothetical protein